MVGIRHRCIPKSDGGVESRHAPKTDALKQVGGTKAKGLLRQTDSSVGRAGPSQGSGRQFESVSDLAGVAPGPSEPKPVFRKPLAKDAHKTLAATKPWEDLGISRRTWYRQQKDRS